MRLGHYKCTTGKRCSSTNWFFMCRVTQISSTVRDKSAAVSPALIQAPAAEKGGKGLLIDQHHVMRFVFGIRAGFWGSLTHGNISSWKRQYLWCRRRLTNGSVEWVSWSGSQARGGWGGGGLCEKETCLRALPALRSLYLESFLLCGSAFTQKAVSKAYFHCNIQLSKGSITPCIPLRAVFDRWPACSRQTRCHFGRGRRRCITCSNFSKRSCFTSIS